MDITTEAKRIVTQWHENLLRNLIELFKMKIIRPDTTIEELIMYVTKEIKKFKSDTTS